MDDRIRVRRGVRYDKHVRVAVESWRGFERIAAARGLPPGMVLRRALDEYLRRELEAEQAA